MLKIQFKDQRHDATWVVEKLYTIGRAANSHLVIDDDSISDIHAKLITQDNKLYLKDCNSAKGCFVNNQRITQKEVVAGDTIRLGKVEIDILDPRNNAQNCPQTQQERWSLVADSSWLSGQEFEVNQSPAIIGRSSECDITIPGTHLSRQHAELIIQGQTLQVRDLASANGTYLNDEKVHEAIAHPGDRLRLDVYSFRIVGPKVDGEKTRVRIPPAELTATERKTPSTAKKQWKTRPTSPGNREEPTYSNASRLLPWLSGLLCLTMIGALGYLVFGS